MNRVVLSVAGAVLLMGATPAFAITATTSGVSATSSGSKVTVSDTGCDGYAAKARWIRSGSASTYEITNSNGCGTSLSYTTGGTITHLQACSVRTAAPDVCGAWRS